MRVDWLVGAERRLRLSTVTVQNVLDWESGAM
jgi:hypothetical protein